MAEVAELTKSSKWAVRRWYDFACVYAVASGKIADKKMEYGDRAMALLHQAVQAGYKDAAHMKKDTDLDPLRGREDFKKLLAELEEKAEKPPRDRPYAGQLAVLGLNLMQQQKAADAKPVLRDCLAIREKKAPDEWITFNTKSTLGGALLAQKKYADAEPLLLAGYERMKQREAKIPPQGKIRLTEALERLVQLYEAMGPKDEAKKWQAERSKYPPPVAPPPREKKSSAASRPTFGTMAAGGYIMGSITFQTTVTDEQVIRPPPEVRLPLGALEVTIRPVTDATAATSVKLANENLRRCRVSLGHATGIDNEGIDADLARAYGDGDASASPNGKS